MTTAIESDPCAHSTVLPNASRHRETEARLPPAIKGLLASLILVDASDASVSTIHDTSRFLPMTSTDNTRLAVTYQIIQSGATALDEGCCEKALVTLRIALKLLEQSSDKFGGDIATCQTLVGRCYVALGEDQQALDWFKLALPTHTTWDGPCSQSVSAAHVDHGTALLGLGRYDEATQHFKRAVRIDEATLGVNNPTTARRRANLGVGYFKMGQLSSAIRCYSQSMAVIRTHLGDHHPEMAAKWNNIGLAWKAMGEANMAHSAFENALTVDLNTQPPNYVALATTRYNLGITCLSQNQISDAFDHLSSSYQIRQQYLGATHPHTTDAAIALSLVQIVKSQNTPLSMPS